MCYFIPYRDSYTAEQLVDHYAQHIFHIHGLLKSIVSDHGTQFTAKFWKALYKILKTESLLSTPFHPETDSQMERFNAILEQYLRAYINYLQDDWKEWLYIGEFATNNQASETIGLSPFFTNYAQDPLWQFDLTAARVGAEKRDALRVMSKMKEIMEHLQAEILWAQYRDQEQPDKRHALAPALYISDLVWFNA